MRNPFHRHPVCPGCGKRHESLNPAMEVIVAEAVALVTAYPPGTFPRLQLAITAAVAADERAHGSIVPPPPAEPETPAAPVDPIEAEVAKFVAQLDEYPTAEEPNHG
ncbi:hypothetical protein [Promicromonospora kroppenstedtii]|uniref:hypothetical protein n=1 Tax=Promicromonospora kroppenstedtii TaxID=440482 RepID=UPI0004B0AC1E|nr:hypothetical protein [Promicromonospora kroppenstedtii]